MRLKISFEVHTQRGADETFEDEERLAGLADQRVRDCLRDCIAGLVDAARAEGLDVQVVSG
jgi:hypothetical protein